MQLIHGDCLIEMASIEDGSVDMILTDPPYGTTACKWDSVIDLDKMWAHLKRIIKPNGAIVMTASQPFSSVLITSNLSMFRYRWVWDKVQGSNFQLTKLQPMNNVEDIIVFSHGKSANGAKVNCVYNPQMTMHDKPSKSGGTPSTKTLNSNSMVALGTVRTEKYPLAIQTFKKPPNNGRLHPTQKPVALMEYMIKTYTNAGETVMDFTMGSGTTGLACQNLGRDFIGIEMDKTYFDIAQERIEKAQMELLCTI